MRDGDISRSKSQFLALCAPVRGVSSGRRNRVFKAAEATRGILLLNMWGVSCRAVMVLGPVVRTNPEELDRIQKVWNWYPRKVGYGWNGMLRVASGACLGHYPFILFVSEPWWNSVFPLPFLCPASLVPLERKAGADPVPYWHASTKSLLSLESHSGPLPHQNVFCSTGCVWSILPVKITENTWAWVRLAPQPSLRVWRSPI